MNRPYWTRELLIDRIREWTELAGTPPANVDWKPSIAYARGHPEVAAAFEDADGYWPHADIVARRFGSWTRGLRTALDGTPLEPATYRTVGAQQVWSRAQIIECAREWAATHGRPPRTTDWQFACSGADDHRPATPTVYRLFGSWTAMVDAAGCADAAPVEQMS